MPYEITLQKLLEDSDKELHGRLLTLEKKARTLLSYTQGKFPFYTPHDFHHSISVEENLNWIIPDKIKERLNRYEIFFLICAAWLHDWGMIGTEKENPEEIRENHHLRTESNFETLYSTLGFSLHEGRIIGRICKGHRKADLHSIEFDDFTFSQGVRIQTRFLAALLRIADETDITHSRTPEVIYYTLNPTEKSEEEFKKHLNISGIGQLEEPHKIYITAIARDPKGAQTLREVTLKIQNELDSIKSILNQNGLFLDVVELKMETRGFIDKPIAFEINRNKIVDLLIGKHLYGKVDVAIRELVQNSIDTCKLKHVITSDYCPNITLIRMDNERLIISDNGVGMSFSEAKRFLSNIGSSFYQSEDFKRTLGDKAYDPISFFGIGLLSSFLIADGLIIETKKLNEESCKFTIASLSDDWKYEKGSLKDSGTVITLILNDEGKKISILDSLNRYFIEPEITVTFKDIGGSIKKFKSSWSIKSIKERFLEEDDRKDNRKLSKIIELNTDTYNLILVKSNYFRNQLVLFNHGVFVNRLSIIGLNIDYILFLNLKSNLIDLHISRENVIENEKFTTLIYKVFNDIFSSLREKDKDPDKRSYISSTSDLIESRMYLEKFDYKSISTNYPFIDSFLNNIIFPVIRNGKLENLYLNEIISYKDISIYTCNSNDYNSEIALFCDINKKTFAFFNPYKMPEVSTSREEDKAINLLEFIFNVKKIHPTKMDLSTLLLELAIPIKSNYQKILPANVQFATFKKLSPLIVIKEQPVVNEKEQYFGFAYWGNILLWKQLMERDRLDAYEESFRNFQGNRFESVIIVKEPIVYIDSGDEFISAILNKYDTLTNENCIMLQRYFKYLSYLPLVYYELTSCVIFIEVIENIEKTISDSLKIQRPPEIFKRMGPSSSLFIQYYRNTEYKYLLE